MKSLLLIVSVIALFGLSIGASVKSELRTKRSPDDNGGNSQCGLPPNPPCGPPPGGMPPPNMSQLSGQAASGFTSESMAGATQMRTKREDTHGDTEDESGSVSKREAQGPGGQEGQAGGMGGGMSDMGSIGSDMGNMAKRFGNMLG